MSHLPEELDVAIRRFFKTENGRWRTGDACTGFLRRGVEIRLAGPRRLMPEILDSSMDIERTSLLVRSGDEALVDCRVIHRVSFDRPWGERDFEYVYDGPVRLVQVQGTWLVGDFPLNGRMASTRVHLQPRMTRNARDLELTPLLVDLMADATLVYGKIHNRTRRVVGIHSAVMRWGRLRWHECLVGPKDPILPGQDMMILVETLKVPRQSPKSMDVRLRFESGEDRAYSIVLGEPGIWDEAPNT